MVADCLWFPSLTMISCIDECSKFWCNNQGMRRKPICGNIIFSKYVFQMSKKESSAARHLALDRSQEDLRASKPFWFRTRPGPSKWRACMSLRSCGAARRLRTRTTSKSSPGCCPTRRQQAMQRGLRSTFYPWSCDICFPAFISLFILSIKVGGLGIYDWK